MATNVDKKIKIFSLNRLKFSELWDDAMRYVKSSYNAAGLVFTTASPFGLLLHVVLHLGRMIFYYIEDSITGLNIRTAYRPDQIKGLARLAGHDSARTISARGAIKIKYVDTGNTTLSRNICYIPNKTRVISKINGMTYTVLFGAENGKITMQSGNYLNATLILGTIKMLYSTGTGRPLQSFNYNERNHTEPELFYVNVYVNSEPWEIVSSIQDLGFEQKGCVVKTGINGGLDVFFGNGDMGAIPAEGSYIVCEYLITDGEGANLTKNYVNANEYWEWQTPGVLADGTEIDLNLNFVISLETDVIFGTAAEDTALTLLIAPHASKAFVLANETNYKYFFKRMNMFSDVEIIRGSYSVNGTSVMQLAYDQANLKYQEAVVYYNNMMSLYGASSEYTTSAYKEVEQALSIRNYAATKLSDNTYLDNTIYILLVPDIKKRLGSTLNYFTCDESLFYLSTDEQENIINLINSTGQRIITVENRIILPKVVKFAVNVQAKIWDTYDEQDVYTAGLAKLSEYFINYTRKDMIPVSDIVSIFENDVEGIDSVKVWFDADVNNQDYFGEGNYGLDDYGDIILTRTITDANGQVQTVRDIMPLVRGGFTSANGVEYSANQTKDGISAFNLTITGKSINRKTNLSNYTALT